VYIGWTDTKRILGLPKLLAWRNMISETESISSKKFYVAIFPMAKICH